MVLKKRILVMSKDKMFCSSLRSKLCSDKNQFSFSESFVLTADDVASAQYDLIITELHQFGMGSIVEISASDRSKSTPIMVMYDELSVEEKVLLYQAGASVLIKKSAAIEVCVAQALIRLQNENKIHEKPDPLIFGTELVIDPSCRIVKVDGEILNLTKRSLICCFASSRISGRYWTLDSCMRRCGRMEQSRQITEQ